MCKLCVTGVAVLLLSSVGFSQQWQITQITDNSQDDDEPNISGGKVVWEHDDGTDKEVFLYDGSGITQLTDNDVDDTIPDISGSHVVWYSGSDNDAVDVVYDGQVIMADVHRFLDLQVEPGGAIWSAGGPYTAPSHVYLYDGTTVQQLSLEGTDFNNGPEMSGGNVVWDAYDSNGDKAAYLYDGTTTAVIPANVISGGGGPKISGNNIVGIGITPDGLHEDVYLYDGVTNTQVASTAGWDMLPQIAGQNIAWLSEVDGVHEVFVYEDGQAKQLSFDSVHTYSPSVSESFVAWSADDGSGHDIFIYDGVTTTRLTDNNYDDVVFDIDGAAIVWRRDDGTDREIFMATVPEPTTLMLLTGGVWAMLARKRRRQ